MEMPQIAGKDPIAVDVKKGETYYWCSCGRSASQPFCDASHVGSEFNPVAYTAEEDKTAYFCACKQAKTPPFCDGTHLSL